MKAKCTPKERVLNAFHHVESDRIPIDFGSTANTSITKDAYENLKRFLKIDLPVKLMSKNLSTAYIDDVVLERLNVDTRGVFLGGSDEWHDIELSADKYIDEWGITFYKPPNFPFYDAVKNPLAGEISSKTIRDYPWPNPHNRGRVRNIRERVRFLREHTDYAVVFHAMGGFITQSQYMRGLEQWLEDIIAEPELLGELLDRILQYQMDLAMDALSECDFDVDVVHFGDDLGIQNGLMFSPRTYRDILKPRQAKLFAPVKKHTKAKIFFHTCGSNYDILNDLIEIGVDGLNPVQTNAKNMQADRLKREFGDRLTFWGAVDTHAPGAAEDPMCMEKEVRKVVEIMAPGGGYVFNAIHNIQPDVSAESIYAMFESAIKYGSYH
jgi:uroporphyrinogen decarboxylase